jgi:beta-lactamase regulating signal transducer with metallopeptidase domain/uncharacterized GH25 family protein
MFDTWRIGAWTTEWQQATFLWLLKATVLCLIASVVAAITQRRSADLAHRVWITALAGVVLLPCFSLVSPAWRLAIKSALPSGSATRPYTSSPSPNAWAENGAVEQNPAAAVVSESLEVNVEAASRNLLQSSHDPAHLTSPIPTHLEAGEVTLRTSPWWLAANWLVVGWLVWGLVGFVLLCRLTVGAFRMTALVHASPGAPAALQSRVAAVAAALDVKNRFVARVLPAGSMPMACWMGQWIMFLPDDMADWDESLQKTVIAHELGHLARRDPWWDLLAQLVTRALWPHPLMWIAHHVLPRLRERACDEWVLASGQITKHDYARHLLEVIGRCKPGGSALAPEVGRSWDLERRLRFVLASPLPSRKPRQFKILAVAACLALTAALAGGQPVGFEAAAVDGPAVREERSNQAGVQRTAEPVPAQGPAITIAGVVVTPDGKPVREATVILRAKIGGQWYPGGTPKNNRDVLARTMTDTDGRFAFDKVGIPPRMENVIARLLAGRGGAELLAWAEGWGMTWKEVNGLAGGDAVTLPLNPEAKVIGEIRDKSGRPAADVRVSVFGATRATVEADTFFNQGGDLFLTWSEAAPRAKSDSEGRFVLERLPADYRLMTILERPGLAGKVIFIDTGPNKGVTEIKTRGGRGPTIGVERSPLGVTLEPQRFALIRVRDIAGRPVGGGAVEMIDSQRHHTGMAVVDERGEARLALNKTGRYRVDYMADPLEPKLGKTVTAEIAPGQEPALIDIPLSEPIWQTGRVIDADTGKPVVGAYVAYSRQSDRPSEEANEMSIGVSAANGEFRIPVASGRGSLRFILPVFGYFMPTASKTGAPPDALEIDVAGGAEPKPATLLLSRGLVVRGKVRNPDGKPAGGAIVQARSETPFHSSDAIAGAEGFFEISSGLSPRAGVVLTATGAAGGANITIDAAPEHPLDKTRWQDVEIQLKTGVVLSGRVLYNGQPRPGVVVQLSRDVVEQPSRGGGMVNVHLFPAGETKTDAAGRYRIGGLQAGEQYEFQIIDRDGMVDSEWMQQYGHLHKVAPGRTEIHLPDVHLTTRGQTLAGLVVDTRGKPLQGITVAAQLRGGGPVITSPNSTAPRPWMTTDETGRFELRQLPDRQLELMAYKAIPGQPVRYPSVVATSRNQKDMRIIIDLKLGEDIEDLDAPRQSESKKK